LQQAEDYYKRKQGRTPIGTVAREAVQTAEEARVMSLKREDEERVESEKQAAAAREAQAKADAEAQTQRRQQAEADTQAEAQRRQQAENDRASAEQAKAEADQARDEAERAKQEADLAAQKATQEKADAQAAQAAALAQQQALEVENEKARSQAEEAERGRQKAEADQAEMRSRLKQQLNTILVTRDTARGLVSTMPDVLFQTNSVVLKPAARESLARVSGIFMAYPDLRLEIDGHTDSTGSDSYNQQLSERRAASVRDYVTHQGIPVSSVAIQGFGKTQPVASNATAAGRRQNRRVELVVSGEVIGSKIGSDSDAPTQTQTPAAAPVPAPAPPPQP
jgi:outer membrane protein OmpA-like peptidoglycan-associated protein